tara:strand:- start:512 stop:631 length:120 start_codon:yes stop_codon:yes gene_type:complete
MLGVALLLKSNTENFRIEKKPFGSKNVKRTKQLLLILDD